MGALPLWDVCVCVCVYQHGCVLSVKLCWQCADGHMHACTSFCVHGRVDPKGHDLQGESEAVGGCRDVDPQPTLFFYSAVFGQRAAPEEK